MTKYSNKDYNFFRENYPEFRYNSFEYKYSPQTQTLKVEFDFRAEELSFNPSINYKNVQKNQFESISKPVLENILFHIGLVELPSYWKTVCSPNIVIKAGNLNQNQIDWWHNFYMQSMGEYFFVNKIDFTKKDFLKIQNESKQITNPKSQIFTKDLNPKNVVSTVGGGKDSITALETIKRTNLRPISFLLNPIHVIKKTVETSETDYTVVERNFDKKVIELNKQGYLNGHTPFLAVISFISLLENIFIDAKHTAVACEKSANEGNIEYRGRTINHQYDKTFEFENLFREYAKEYLIEEYNYFSILRPLYEIQIAKIFSKFKKYFSKFSSCNINFIQKNLDLEKIQWCCKCPKCTFIFLIIYPFAGHTDTLKIFKENLLKKESLIPTLEELVGERHHKPLECVGTVEESILALHLCVEESRRISGSESWPFIKFYNRRIKSKYNNFEELKKKFLENWDPNHNLPKEISKILREETLNE